MTTKDNASRISQIIQEHEAEIGSQWISQLEAMIVRGTSSSREQLRTHCQQFLAAFAHATNSGELENIEHRSWDEVRDLLTEISSTRAKSGSTRARPPASCFRSNSLCLSS